MKQNRLASAATASSATAALWMHDKRPETSASIHRTGINLKREHSFSSGTGKRLSSRLLLVTAFNIGTSGGSPPGEIRSGWR
ncbi:hypothetical protein KCP78_24850 [Salmonella enterica subsp. enterica]|nr:hypothetical protein KCP78_24850 [Salmonella enterica subsp. enterica]